jgi:hypothetical protein
MNRGLPIVIGLGVAVGALAVGRFLWRKPLDGNRWDRQQRWLIVTVDRPRDEIPPGEVWSRPLADWADSIDVELRRAPGDKGTEIAVRLRDAERDRRGFLGSRSQVRDIRSALRRTKQLLETGEILRVDPQPHGRRRTTPGSAVVAAVTKRSEREGTL